MKAKEIFYLVIDTTDVDSVRNCLHKAAIEFRLTIFRSLDTLKHSLNKLIPDIVFADPGNASFDLAEVMSAIREYSLYTPLIVISKTFSEHISVNAMQAGASDHVSNKTLSRLPSAVVKALSLSSERKKEKDKRRKLEQENEKLKNRLQLAVNSCHFGIWEMNISTGELLWDEMMYKIYSKDKSTFKPAWSTSIHPDDLKDQYDKMVSLTGEGKIYKDHFRIVLDNGEIRHIEITAIKEKDIPASHALRVGTVVDITERIDHQQKLIDSEVKYRSIIESSMDGILITTLSGKIISANDAAEKIFGMTEAEMQLEQIQLVDPEDSRLQTLAEIRRQHNKVRGELNFIRKNGIKFPGEVCSVVFGNASGKYLAATTIRDITESKQKEISLKLNDAFSKGILNSLNSNIAVINQNGTIVRVNKSWVDFALANGAKDISRLSEGACYFSFGITEEAEHYGSRKALNGIRAVLSGVKESFHMEYPCHSPLIKRWFNMRVLKFESDTAYVVIEHQDISERKLSELALSEKQQQLLTSQRIAKLGSCDLTVHDFDDFKEWEMHCSEETYRILELQPLSAFKFSQFLQFVEADFYQVIIDSSIKALKHSVPLILEFKIHTAKGSIKWLQYEGKTKQTRKSGKLAKISGTLRDITVLKEHQLAVEKHAKERELLIEKLSKYIDDLKQFSFITSHNFRAPLSNLIGLLNLIDYKSLHNDNKHIVDMFRSATEQLNKTINDLIFILQIKNTANINYQLIEIEKMIDDVLMLMTAEIERSQCIVKRYLNVTHIVYNKSYMQSILFNLISNAIQFREKSRQLIITISTYKNNMGNVILEIRDNGSGIDLNRHAENIFGMYQRFHSEGSGTGLGLFMIKSQIVASGGSIKVQSEPGKFTSFLITFKNDLPIGDDI